MSAAGRGDGSGAAADGVSAGQYAMTAAQQAAVTSGAANAMMMQPAGVFLFAMYSSFLFMSCHILFHSCVYACIVQLASFMIDYANVFLGYGAAGYGYGGAGMAGYGAAYGYPPAGGRGAGETSPSSADPTGAYGRGGAAGGTQGRIDRSYRPY